MADAIEYGKKKASESKGRLRLFAHSAYVLCLTVVMCIVQSSSALIGDIMDKLSVNFGVEITKIVPGVVSTEVDAR